MRVFTFVTYYFLSVLSLNAQTIPKDILERVYKSDYIFEAEVIRCNSYFTQGRERIYTSSTLEIYKIFKGNLVCGTVEVITNGGTFGDWTENISENLMLRKGMKGIFLCNETWKELPLTNYYPETNTIVLDIPYQLQGYVRYFEDEINPLIYDYQFSLDSLAQVYDLMDLLTQVHFVDCQGGREIVSKHRHSTDLTVPVPQLVNGTNDTILTYTLVNPHVADSIGKHFYEFDIALSDNQNNIYFRNAIIRIHYDPLTFGSNIHTNNKIWVHKQPLLADSVTYHSVTTADSPNDVVLVTIPGTYSNPNTN